MAFTAEVSGQLPVRLLIDHEEIKEIRHLHITTVQQSEASGP